MKENKRILTIVIPSFNMEKYLQSCLQSLVISAEDMAKLDVIVVNDGSRDGTSEIGHAFASQYPESIRIVDKPNGHYGSCVNCGVEMAKGEFIKVLDADDSFYGENLPDFIHMLEGVGAEVDLVISNLDEVDETGQVTGKTRYALPRCVPFGIGELLSLPRIVVMHALAYRTRLIRDIGYRQTEGMLYTDGEWCFKPMARVRSIRYFENPIYRYLVGRQGQSVSQYGRFASMQEHLLHELVEYYCKMQTKVSHDTRNYLYKFLLHIVGLTYDNYILRADLEDAQGRLTQVDDYIVRKVPSLRDDLPDSTLPGSGPLRFHYLRQWLAHRSLPRWQMRLMRLYLRWRTR